MFKATDRVGKALKEVGARLKRHRKHLVYELPNGRNVVMAKTPSDYRAEENVLRDIRKATGVPREAKPTSEPKERRKKPGRMESPTAWSLPESSVSPLASALRDNGLVEQALRAQIDELERQLRRARWKVERLQRPWWQKVQEQVSLWRNRRCP